MESTSPTDGENYRIQVVLPDVGPQVGSGFFDDYRHGCSCLISTFAPLSQLEGLLQSQRLRVVVLVPPYDQSLLEKHLFCFLGSNQQYSYTCMRGSSTPVSLLPFIFILAHLPCVLENTDTYIHNSSAAKIHTSSPLQDFPLKAVLSESQCLPLGWAEDLVRSQARELLAE